MYARRFILSTREPIRKAFSMHHQRRKSGHASGNSSMTDLRKAEHKTTTSRPAPITRRTTPQVMQKLGKNPRDREREWEDERLFDEERESFPQYWYVSNFVFCLLLSALLHSPPSSPERSVGDHVPSARLSSPPFGQAASSPDMQVIGVTQSCAVQSNGKGKHTSVLVELQNSFLHIVSCIT